MYDINSIRAQFPALTRQHDGRAVAYFDGPGGTQVPRIVGDAIADYLYHHNANTHWVYPSSVETDAMLVGARKAVAAFLNCSPAEVAFGANMTTLTFHVARALGRTFEPGDEIIVTELDHHANVAPWFALERDRGIVLRMARVNTATFQLDYDHLASLVTPRTRLIAVGGASNATGTINDLERVAAIARDARVLLFVDAVHLAPHELIDVKKIDCDFLACSSYKFYGPHAGILYGRETLLSQLPFPKLAPSPDTSPERVETGTQNHEAIAGIRATIEFLASMGEGTSLRERLESSFAALHEHEHARFRRLWKGLGAIPGVRLYGPAPDQRRTPTVAFTLDGVDAETVCRRLADAALFTSHGNFYAATIVERLGVTDLVRIGVACYTTDEEIDRVIDAVRGLAS
jgi:cysteine desulfurase family protein (TIGR01976 family)